MKRNAPEVTGGRNSTVTTLDPEWPGNWEGEEEPRTQAIPDSLGTSDLFMVLEADHDKRSFKQYTPIVHIYIVIVVLAIFAAFIAVFLSLELTAILLFTSLFFIGIIRYEGRKYQTLVTNRGVGGIKPWSPFAAIEWHHIEHIEVHTKKNRVNEIVFRGNDRILWHDNSFLARRLTLEVVKQCFPSFDEWQYRPKLGWAEGTYIYSRPGSELVIPEGSVGRRAVDEFDEDLGHYATTEIVGSLESEELLELIKKDPGHDKYGRLGNAGFVLVLSLTFTAVALLSIHPILLIHGWEVVMPAYAVMTIIWVMLAVWMVRETRRHGYYLSPIGIGAVESFMPVRAIRWEHVEWVDVWMDNGSLHLVEFAGNQRAIRIINQLWHREFTLADLESYLPVYKTWRSYRDDDWKEGVLRYRR